MSRKLMDAQILAAAKKLNISIAALRAVIEVECKGEGFNNDGTPVILFERHVFRRRLIANEQPKILKTVSLERPDLCNTVSGGYGKSSEQNKRLEDAARYHRASALEACSWGIGQVMGYHWKDLGYQSLQAFINAMYKDEYSQLLAMCNFIQINKLDRYLRNLDWASFARGYNGEGYKKNKYDEKLAQAHAKFVRIVSGK